MGPGEEGGVREGGGREEAGSRREGPAETTSFSYVQFAQRELCSAPQGASTGEKSQMPRNKNNFTTSAMQKSAQAIQYPYEMQHSSVTTFWTTAHFGHCRENLYKKLA